MASPQLGPTNLSGRAQLGSQAHPPPQQTVPIHAGTETPNQKPGVTPEIRSDDLIQGEKCLRICMSRVRNPSPGGKETF